MILSNESHDQSHDVPINEDELIAYLYTLGETCQVLPEYMHVTIHVIPVYIYITLELPVYIYMYM